MSSDASCTASESPGNETQRLALVGDARLDSHLTRETKRDRILRHSVCFGVLCAGRRDDGLYGFSNEGCKMEAGARRRHMDRYIFYINKSLCQRNRNDPRSFTDSAEDMVCCWASFRLAERNATLISV